MFCNLKRFDRNQNLNRNVVFKPSKSFKPYPGRMGGWGPLNKKATALKKNSSRTTFAMFKKAVIKEIFKIVIEIEIWPGLKLPVLKKTCYTFSKVIYHYSIFFRRTFAHCLKFLLFYKNWHF